MIFSTELQRTTRCTGVAIFIPSASPVFNDGDPMFVDAGRADAEKELGVPVPDESPVESGLESAERVRTEFPETWLWSDLTAGYIWYVVVRLLFRGVAAE